MSFSRLKRSSDSQTESVQDGRSERQTSRRGDGRSVWEEKAGKMVLLWLRCMFSAVLRRIFLAEPGTVGLFSLWSGLSGKRRAYSGIAGFVHPELKRGDQVLLAELTGNDAHPLQNGEDGLIRDIHEDDLGDQSHQVLPQTHREQCPVAATRQDCAP